jgi:hypothetical protein
MAEYGYGSTVFPPLSSTEYQIYSSYKIQGGIGDNLAEVFSYNPQ